MNTQGFTAGRASLNVTVNDTQSKVVNAIIAAGLDQGKPVAIFANETGGSQTGNLMCPLTATQDNGSAPWVDTTQDLTTLGVDPANDLLYLQVWVEATQNYYMAGTTIKMLAGGIPIAECLE
jgi:hypothetical protein